MHLRDLLIRIAETYDPKSGTSHGVPAQDLLREVERMTDLPLPHGFVASGYGGKGGASSTPWIGVFAKSINVQAQEGLYLAYIFDATRASVTLTLQQGVTRLSDTYPKLGDRLRELKRRARHLRAGLEPELAAHWAHTPVFASKLERPRAYEAASVAARRYEIASMPTEEALAEELRVASLLLRDAAASHRVWLQQPSENEPLVYEGAGHLPLSGDDPLDGFRPNDSSDYYVHIKGGRRRRERPHEELIKDFGLHVVMRGYQPITLGMYPRDLVLRRPAMDQQRSWLVEGKAVKKGNATQAVREAVAQLFEYSYYWHQKRGEPKPHLVALFTEDIGHYAEYLEEHGIASVWRVEGADWAGSPTAVSWDLAGA
ncbi:MrcB family domain-containing protein [Streptomyces sp. NPDC059696]|uniref:MrcB family domain-containing protein n=1 Tax=Streptomyces sp. NPDC059696 TaxID=3346911 RepID=UPI0036C1441F